MKIRIFYVSELLRVRTFTRQNFYASELLRVRVSELLRVKTFTLFNKFKNSYVISQD